MNRGVTQRDLAARIGTSTASLSSFENGRRGTSVETVLRVLNELGVEILLQEAPPPSEEEARLLRMIGKYGKETNSDTEPVARTSMPSLNRARCGEWMPRSRAYCILPTEHTGGCRSRR